MALSYKKRRWLSVLVLLVGMPLYVVIVITILNRIPHPPFPLDVLLYIVLGVAWVFPLKSVFKGVGQADPDAPPIIYDDERPGFQQNSDRES